LHSQIRFRFFAARGAWLLMLGRRRAAAAAIVLH
jgi:hypothetical protein